MSELTQEQALLVDGLDFAYGPDRLFKELSFSVRAGELTFAIGPNGCGKSTLAQLLMGQLLPNRGSISWFGNALKGMSAEQRVNLIGYLPTEIDVYIPFRVTDLVQIHKSVIASKVRQAQYLEKFHEIKDLVGLDFDLERRLNELSTGEKKKVFLSLALARSPSYLVLDEPDVHLDIDTATSLYRVLEKISAQGTGIFCISHDLNLALRFAHRILLLNKKHQIEYHGPVGKGLWAALKKVYAFDFHIVKTKSKSFVVPK